MKAIVTYENILFNNKKETIETDFPIVIYYWMNKAVISLKPEEEVVFRQSIPLHDTMGEVPIPHPLKLYTREEMFNATQNAFLWAMDDTDELVKEEHKLWFNQKFPI